MNFSDLDVTQLILRGGCIGAAAMASTVAGSHGHKKVEIYLIFFLNN
jgi:hypothetical protein